MTVRHFLFTLEDKINTKYPDLQPEFYVAKRSKSIHMGLNRCLMNIFNLKNGSLTANSFILYWLIQQNGDLIILF